MSLKTRQVKGFIGNNYAIFPVDIVAKFTTDEFGESITLQVEDLMIGCRFEKVEELIEDTRKAEERERRKNEYRIFDSESEDDK